MDLSLPVRGREVPLVRVRSAKLLGAAQACLRGGQSGLGLTQTECLTLVGRRRILSRWCHGFLLSLRLTLSTF